MSTTDGASTIFTPTTSAAPSVAGDARPKLPLAARKNIRDGWENKQPELEERLSKILGTPWEATIDPPMLFSYCDSSSYDRYPRERPGEMIAEYISTACDCLERFAEKYPDGGIAALNAAAFNHTITILPTTDPEISYSGCAIKDGSLALLFNEKQLGTNVYSAADLLDKALDAAEVANPQFQTDDGSGPTRTSFLARMSIKEQWATKAPEITETLREIVASPTLQLIPNFEANFHKLNTYATEQNLKHNYDFRRDWKVDYGKIVFQYFDGLAYRLKEQGFAGDDMLQEGFRDGVEKNEIGVRVVDKLKEQGAYNESVIEGGVLWVQMLPKNWAVNIDDPGKNVIDLL